MKRHLALLAAVLLTGSLAAAAETPADQILTGARVWTADAAHPWAEAVAIRGDRLVYVGDAAGVEAYRGPKTRVDTFHGGLILPGFNDAHVHLMGAAESLDQVDLIEDESLEAVQARIRDFAASHADRPWVVGQGWLYSAFPGGLPTKEQLDAVVPDRPAYMDCYDGHSGWANSKALALAGITKDTKDPENGLIVRDPETGEPTGALKESATSLVTSKIPPLSPEERYALLVQAYQVLSSEGITSVQDAGYSAKQFASRDLPLFERAEREGKLTTRTRFTIVMQPGNPGPGIAEAKRLAGRHDGGLMSFGAVKGFVDGVVEAKTAAMLTPYPGTDSLGLPNWTPSGLTQAVVAADAEGLQVWLHAIGDRGVRMALDAHQAALEAHGRTDRRGRIEHIETISPADYPRFKALGVIASMQPLHADPNSNIFEVWAKNAGPDRASRGFGWRNIEKAGARLVFGSDWPVVTSDVFRGLYCAVTRKTKNGTPPGGWLPEQAVSLESALHHYTIDGAFASFEEKQKGSLVPGKLADVIVLSEDLLKTPPETILKTKVLLTIMDGRVVYQAK